MTASDTDRALIGHLLRRGGFGASGPEIDAACAAGYAATVESFFSAGSDPGVEATPAPDLGTGTPGAKQGANSAEAYDLIAWWLRRMTAVQNPWPEKRTYFWHGHFATSIAKVKSAALMLAQNQTERSLGGGMFPTLMRAVFTDPAMMIWLDAEGNTAKAPNENLARESMELFSLGVGNYTETDVREAALALTGWRLQRGTYQPVFNPRVHAPGPETILGKTASFDVDSFTALLMAQPANAKFLAARHWMRLGAVSAAPSATSQALISAYGTAGDLGGLARALFNDPSFTGAVARYGLVKQPVEYVVGVMRALKISPPADGSGKDSQVLRSALDGLGQVPFDPPNVGGWPSGLLWLTTAAAQARINFTRWAVKTGDISAVEDAAAGSRIDTVGYQLGVDAFSDRTRAALSDVAGDPSKLVQLALLSPEHLVN